MPGALHTGSLACEWIEAHEHSHHGYAERSGIPCAVVYGLLRTLPGVPGFLAPVPPGSRHVGRKADIA
jgi:hypothetical protein